MRNGAEGNSHRFSGNEATIVAPATPPGTGSVSILRLSGPSAFSISTRLTGVDPEDHPSRTLALCTVRNASGAEVDAGLVAYFPAPNSLTGEDVAEIHMHGNPVIVAEVAESACFLGARPAEPGEFSRRAFENGKMDLTQAEGLCDLIAARTEASARAALRQYKGGIRDAIVSLKERMFSLLVLLEAAIDFSDEDDATVLTSAQLQERVSELRNCLLNYISSYDIGHRLRDGAIVAIAGVANVGKSSLLNRLLGEERAIVTEIPGTTRDYLCGELSLSGIPFRLVDTAGLRDTGDPVEREGVRRSRDILARADMTLFLLDGSRPAGDGDRLAYAEVAERPHFLLLNKSDLPAAESGEGFSGTGIKGIKPVSAKTGEGLDGLLAALSGELVSDTDTMEEAPMTRMRHVDAARKAVAALERAEKAAAQGLSPEFPAADVREAALALSEITGEIAPEDVLDAIFRSFCIGK